MEKHGAERSQARNFMACVKLNPKGHLKYYAIQFGSPQPGDLLLDHKLSAEEQSSLRLTVSDSRLVSVLIFAVMLIKMHFIGFFFFTGREYFIPAHQVVMRLLVAVSS